MQPLSGTSLMIGVLLMVIPVTSAFIEAWMGPYLRTAPRGLFFCTAKETGFEILQDPCVVATSTGWCCRWEAKTRILAGPLSASRSVTQGGGSVLLRGTRSGGWPLSLSSPSAGNEEEERIVTKDVMKRAANLQKWLEDIYEKVDYTAALVRAGILPEVREQ